MPETQEFTFLSSDGVHQVHAVQWLPDLRPHAVVQLVHGVSEHIRRYDDFARFLCSHGYAVLGNDHLGHGRTSEGPEEYGFIGERGGWRHISNDIDTLRRLAEERFPGIPFFLMGHSMGSFLVRLYLIDRPGTVTGAILSGTGQQPPLLIAFGKWLAGLECLRLGARGHSRLIDKLSFGAYNRHFLPIRTPSDWISRDTAVVDAYVADPLCSFYPTVSTFRNMMEGLQYISAAENLRKMQLSTPVYFFSGSCDPVGSCGTGVKKAYDSFRNAGCTDLTLRLYPEGRHEMLNELNRDEVYVDVLAWLERHLTAVPNAT